MRRFTSTPKRFMCLAVSLTVLFGLGPGIARATDYSNIRIVRLSFVEGDVQYMRPNGDWEAAQMNLPIQQGYALQTGNGYAEVEFENGLAVRLANDTSMEFTELALVDGRIVTHLTISQGTALVSADLAHHEELTINASNLNLEVPRSGKFRIDVSTAESWVSVFKGNVMAEGGANAPYKIGGGHSLRETAADLGSLQVVKNPANDAFDKWVSQREQALSAAKEDTADYLHSKYYNEGFADLAGFGNWTSLPGYGEAWIPYGVGAGWTPYVNGQWLFLNNTGWNWVSADPWGWVPYHFGNWLLVPGAGWAWVPGGLNTWQPTTATFVTVNNQLGWVPTPPTAPAKGPARPPARPVFILAARNANGSLTAASHTAIGEGTAVHAASAPAPPVMVAHGPLHASAPIYTLRQSAAVPPHGLAAPGFREVRPQAHNFPGPAGMRAPGVPAGPAPMARPDAGFHAMAAPHSMPGPGPIHAGGGPGNFGGGRDSGGGMRSGRAGPSGAGANRAVGSSVPPGAHSVPSAPSSHASPPSGGASAPHR